MLENAARLQAQADTEDIGEALAGAAEDFYSKRESELSGVLSTVNRHTKFLDYRAFRGVMQRSDFSLRDLKRNPSGVSLYLCFPATRADISRRWMRLFINQLLDAMEREQTVPEAPVLVCLDEELPVARQEWQYVDRDRWCGGHPLFSRALHDAGHGHAL